MGGLLQRAHADAEMDVQIRRTLDWHPVAGHRGGAFLRRGDHGLALVQGTVGLALLAVLAASSGSWFASVTGDSGKASPRGEGRGRGREGRANRTCRGQALGKGPDRPSASA